MDNTAAPRLQDTTSFTSSIFCKYTHDRADARARGRLEEDEDGDEDEDYRRSAGTVMAHEFERVEEENKEALLEDERAGRESEHAWEQRREEEEDLGHFRPAAR